MLIVTCDGTVNGFCLANPKLAGERKHAQQMLEHRPANRPGTAVVTDKGFAGEDFEGFRYFPNWLRQRVEAIIWTLKNQLGLERHGGRVPAGLWARVLQRVLALNAAIWHNWAIGAPHQAIPGRLRPLTSPDFTG
jgi:hypothetical protein